MASPIELVCPRCRKVLRGDEEELRCGACATRYPIVLGIPDLRVCPDPYIDFDADRAKARTLFAHSGTDLAELIRFYWSITPGTPVGAAARYTAYALRAEARARSVLETDEESGAGGAPSGALLDLGTGTGGMLVAARERHAARVGADVALRWLVIARRRLEERGIEAELVCACADHLPFPDRSFARVTGIDVLEHAGDAGRVLAGAARVTRADGDALFTTTNRWSLLPDPNAGLPHISPSSPGELRNVAKRAFESVEIGPPRFSAGELELLPPAERRMASLWNRLRRLAPLRPLLVRFGPLLWIRCREPLEQVG